MRIGVHPSNTSLAVFSRRPDTQARLAAAGIEGRFFRYGSGNQTVPLFTAGALHLGGTGSTPPLHAAARGLDVTVLATTAPRPDVGGLVVPADGPVTEVIALAGRSVAMMPMSWHPQFLAGALGAAGLGWHDVTAVELDDTTAADALCDGLIDAWVVTEPTLGALRARRAVRVLAPVTTHHSNRSVIWSLRRHVDRAPERYAAVLTALDASDRRIGADAVEAATLLGVDVAAWSPVLAARPWGLTAPDADFVAEQQEDADLLAAAGVLARPVRVADTVHGPAFPTDREELS